MNIKILIVSITLLTLAIPGFANELTVSEILEKTKAAYETINTYRAQGTVSQKIRSGRIKRDIKIEFSILLKKPDQYLITWKPNAQQMGLDASGAVWSDGSQPYFYLGMKNAYYKIENDEIAIGMATDVSAGAATTVPSFFLSIFEFPQDLFYGLTAPQIKGSVRADEDSCYIIGGTTKNSEKLTFWISKSSFLIKRYYISLDNQADGNAAAPKMTSDQLKEYIKSMGQDVTTANMQKLRMMETFMQNLQTKKRHGYFIETHKNISTPKLFEEDFIFDLPKDALLKDNLFEYMMPE